MFLDLSDTTNMFTFRKKYRNFLQQDILFDVEPLLLYLLGIYNDEKLLNMYQYSKEDYIFLLQLIELLKKSPMNFVITPQILFSAIRDLQYDCEGKYKDSPYCKIILQDISKILKPVLKKIREVEAKKDGIISHSNFLKGWKLHSISLDIVDKEKENCRIILTNNHLIGEKFEKDPNILVMYFRYLQVNASIIPRN